jgi:hypothetical protein
MVARTILTRDEYHLSIRQNVDALKARLNLPAFFAAEQTRNKVLYYFMERAVQTGEACFRILDLQLPLSTLARLQCEDFLVMYWVSLSENNATEYSKTVVSEMAKVIRKNLKNKRAGIKNRSTGEDATAEFLPELTSHIGPKKTLEEISRESGLGKVFDIVYRYNSLEAHANTFGLSEMKSEMDGVLASISAINAFLRAILLVADNIDRPVPAGQILLTLNMRYIPGT